MRDCILLLLPISILKNINHISQLTENISDFGHNRKVAILECIIQLANSHGHYSNN